MAAALTTITVAGRTRNNALISGHCKWKEGMNEMSYYDRDVPVANIGTTLTMTLITMLLATTVMAMTRACFVSIGLGLKSVDLACLVSTVRCRYNIERLTSQPPLR